MIIVLLILFLNYLFFLFFFFCFCAPTGFDYYDEVSCGWVDFASRFLIWGNGDYSYLFPKFLFAKPR
ncbi:hypothetical protein, partial [Vibrio sp. V01_P9A10T6]|uniref:hypothetical protein n=1 Tax=Vibrio sp. V01_P9A10T6 TaxID=2116368 RepID=UPI001C6279B3